MMDTSTFSRTRPGLSPPRRSRVTRVGATALGAVVFLTLGAPVQARELSANREMPGSFADLAAKVMPAVVNIATEGAAERQSQDQLDQLVPQVPENSPLHDLFRRFRERQGPGAGQPFAQRTRSLGSGFIVDAGGHVVTNNHVIEKAAKIGVTLQDGRTLSAKVVGRDAKTDLALLKIESDKPLPFVSFGDSSQVRVGDWVMAVGNPFGLGGSLTIGVLSARNRDIHSGPYDEYLQTDAAINRGNSGGPLFDMRGQVIGINTAIYSPSGAGNVGVGFAIPSSIVSKVVAELREHGKVERGGIGVRIQAVTDDLAKALELKQVRGALVVGAEQNSPAAKAGLREGDVILAVGEQAIKQPRDLAQIVAAMKKGSSTKLTVWRDGKEAIVDITIGEQPEAKTARADENTSPDSGAGKGRYGLALAPLTPAARQGLGLAESTQGVLIARVESGSPAADQGLESGDVLVKVGRDKVTTPDEAIAKLNAAKNEKRPVLMMISRRGEMRFVTLSAAQS